MGEQLAIVIADGTNDPANEFNLSVHDQDELTPLETFENLSMVPDAPNFVETVTSSSKYIRVAVNAANTNVQAGTSRGAAAPQSLQVHWPDAVPYQHQWRWLPGGRPAGGGRERPGPGSGFELGCEYRRCHHLCRPSIDEAAGLNGSSCLQPISPARSTAACCS